MVDPRRNRRTKGDRPLPQLRGARKKFRQPRGNPGIPIGKEIDKDGNEVLRYPYGGPSTRDARGRSGEAHPNLAKALAWERRKLEKKYE